MRRLIGLSLIPALVLSAAGCRKAANTGVSVLDRRAPVYVADAGAKVSAPAEAAAPRFTLTINETELQPDGVLTGTVRGKWSTGGLRLLWIDGLNRVAGVSELDAPAGGTDTVALSVKVPIGALGRQHRLAVVSVSKNAAKQPGRNAAESFRLEAEAPFRVARAVPGTPEYAVAIGGTGTLKDDNAWQQLRQLGISAAFCEAREGPAPFVRQDIPFFGEVLPRGSNPLEGSADWSAKTGAFEAQRKDGQLVPRTPALFDDAAIERVRGMLEQCVTAKRAAGPLVWSLGDALSVTHDAAPFDYDGSPATLEVFRGWLQQRYPALEDLNLAWGSDFRRWEEIVPPPTDAVKAAQHFAYADRLGRWLNPESLKAAAQPQSKLSPAPAAASAPLSAPAKSSAQMPPRAPGANTPKPSAASAAVPADAAEKDAPKAGPFELAWEDLSPPVNENFAAWCDWRAFNDFAFARLLREFRSAVRAAGGTTPVGFTGAQPPAAFGGWDWRQIARSVDWLEEHQAPWTRTLARSFAPGLRNFTQLEAAAPADIHRLWDGFLRGDDGCMLGGPENWLRAGTQAQPALKTLAPELAALASGLALQRNCGQVRHDPVAVYYSPQSLRVHWLLDSALSGSHWAAGTHAHAGWNSGLAQMEAWTMLLEDLGCEPVFLNPEQLLGSRLDLKKIKVVILPKVVSLGEAEARAFREFAERGGVVIADGACGTFDNAGRRRPLWGDPRPCGALDAEFGIARKDFVTSELGGEFHGDAAQARVSLKDAVTMRATGPDSPELRVLEPGVTARGAFAYGLAANGAAALAGKPHGLGRFVYLNLCLQDYPQLRAKSAAEFQFRGISYLDYENSYGKPAGGEALRVVIGDVLTEFVPEPELCVLNAEGVPLRGIRRVHFDLGPSAQIAALFVNGRAGKDGGVLGLSVPAAQTAWLKLPAAAHCYDLRSGEYLGRKQMAPVTLDPLRPALIAVLPYQVNRLGMKLRRLSPAGAFKVSAAVEPDSGLPVRHVLHLEVYNPAGQPIPHYTRNVVAEGGAWSGPVILGLNEPAGAYRLVLRDVLSGKTAQGELLKEAAEYTEFARPAEPHWRP